MPALYTPKLREPVRDNLTGDVGEYMGAHGGQIYLRPRGGGREWVTRPHDIRPLAPPDPQADR